MNSRKNKTILATVASVAIIFAIGSCHNSSNPIGYAANAIDNSASGKNGTLKTQEYKIFTQNKLQGVKDSRGKVLIPAQYDKIESVNLQQGYAIATQRGLQGAIDLKNRILLPFEYDTIGTRFYHSDFLLGTKNNLTDLYNLSDRAIVLTGLEHIAFFLGDANYGHAQKDGKQGIVDVRGNIVVPFKYDKIVQFHRNLDYRAIFTGINGKKGIIDFDYGHILIPPAYDRLDYLDTQNDYGIVTQDGQRGIYDPKTDRFTPLEYDEVELLSPDRYAYYTANHRVKNLKPIKDGVVSLVKEGNKTRLLLNNFYPTELKYVIVTKNNKQGILDINTGKKVVSIEYDTIESNPNTQEYAIATRAAKWGILKIEDNTFIPINGTEIDSSLLDRGYALFTQQRKEGVIDLMGKVIVPAQFDLDPSANLSLGENRLIADKYLIASQNGRGGLLNLQTKEFRASDYARIISSGHNIDLESGYSIAIEDNKQGIIDLKGNLVVPLAEDRIIGYRDGVVLRQDSDSFAPPTVSLATENTANTKPNPQDLSLDDVVVLTVSGKYSNYFCVINRQGKLLFKSRHHNWGAREKIDNFCRSFVGIEVDNNSIQENPRPTELGDYNYLIRDGLIAINVNGKWGFANGKGDIAIEPQFDNAGYFSEGLAAIAINDRWGYIDRTGKIAIKPQFDTAKSFNNSMATVKKGDREYAIDTKGRIVADL